MKEVNTFKHPACDHRATVARNPAMEINRETDKMYGISLELLQRLATKWSLPWKLIYMNQ